MSFERFFNKAVEEGKEYELDIKAISRCGDRVARTEGFAVFIPQTMLGEHVKVRINSVGPRLTTEVV